MNLKSKKTHLGQSGWNIRGNVSLRRYKSGFSKLKEMFGNEVMKTNKTKLTSKTLTKEDKRLIKDKIKDQIVKQNKRKVFALILSLLITILSLIAIAYVLSLFYEL